MYVCMYVCMYVWKFVRLSMCVCVRKGNVLESCRGFVTVCWSRAESSPKSIWVIWISTLGRGPPKNNSPKSGFWISTLGRGSAQEEQPKKWKHKPTKDSLTWVGFRPVSAFTCRLHGCLLTEVAHSILVQKPPSDPRHLCFWLSCSVACRWRFIRPGAVCRAKSTRSLRRTLVISSGSGLRSTLISWCWSSDQATFYLRKNWFLSLHWLVRLIKVCCLAKQ